MEKKTWTIILCVCVLMLISGCGETKMNHYEQIKEEYMELCTKMKDNSEMSQTEIADTYANLCKKISEGKAEQAKEYVGLLREIIGGTAPIAEDEVFELAADYGDIFAEMASGKTDFGLQDIATDGQDEMKVTISYKGEVRAYSVQEMEEEEMEYSDSGDELIMPDSSFGKHRVKIEFYDANPSDAFLQKYSVGKVHQIDSSANVLLNIRCTYTSDHGFVIYIGSESLLDVKEQGVTELTRPMGNIEIIIGREEK